MRTFKEILDWAQMIILLILFIVLGLPLMLLALAFFIVIMIIGSVVVLLSAVITSPIKLYQMVKEMKEKKHEDN